MNPPDYRAAACCWNCYYLSRMGNRCVKYRTNVDYSDVCADFVTKEDVEGKEEK